MKRNMLTAAAGLFALSMTVGTASATTVFSDNFEAPVNSQNWQVYQNFGTWGGVTGAGIEIQRNGAVGGVTANSGIQYVELDSDTSRGGTSNPTNSSMTTRLNLAAGTYEVSFYYQPRTSTAGDNNIGVYIAGASQGLFTTLLGTASGVSPQTPPWQLVTYRFTVNGLDNAYGLTFRAEGNQNTLGGFIDDVSVALVPVPAALPLLALGLGALGVAGYRRRKTA